MRSAGIAVMGSAIPVRRCLFGPAVWSSHPTVMGGWFSIRPRTSLRVPRPFRALHGRGQPTARRRRRLLWTFVPYDTCGNRGPVHPGIATPGTFRPQGLATLATVCSLDGLVRLVSDGQRLWGLPFGAFSSFEVVVHSCTTRPACRHRGLSPRRTEARRGDKTEDRLPGASSHESLATKQVFSLPSAGSSHGLRPSQGDSPRALTGISARLLPRR
jgi:hypothetical protein